MTIEELIDFIDNDNYCSDYKCLDDNCKECQKKYIDKFLAEHDKQIIAEVIKDSLLKDCESCEAHLREQIRAEAIEEIVDAVCCHSAFTNMQKDAIRIYAEQLKEQNK